MNPSAETETTINQLEELQEDVAYLRAMCLILSAALAKSEAVLGEARATIAELEQNHRR